MHIFLMLFATSLSLDCTAALAEDHFNDVLSNTAALITASIAFHTPYWWMDPLGKREKLFVVVYLYLSHCYFFSSRFVLVNVACVFPSWSVFFSFLFFVSSPYFHITGAILISLVIIYRWVDIINEQVKKIVGHTAPQDYIEKVLFLLR